MWSEVPRPKGNVVMGVSCLLFLGLPWMTRIRMGSPSWWWLASVTCASFANDVLPLRGRVRRCVQWADRLLASGSFVYTVGLGLQTLGMIPSAALILCTLACYLKGMWSPNDAAYLRWHCMWHVLGSGSIALVLD